MSGGSGGSLFGNLGQNKNNQTTPQPGSLFGGAATTSSASQSNIFSTGATANTGSSLFGASNNTQASGSLFSGTVNQNSGSLFSTGSGSTGGGFSLASNNADANAKKDNANPFASFNTPNKQTSSDATGQAQNGGLFSQQGNATPTKKLFGSNDTSTTPAGPPPANASTGLFASQPTTKPGGLFSSTGDNTSNATPAGQTASSGSLFGTPSSQPPGGNLFQTAAAQNKDASGQTPTTNTLGTASTQQSGFKPPSFGSTPASQSTATNTPAAAPAPATSSNLFSNAGGNSGTNPASAPNPPTNTTNLFANLGGGGSKTTSSAQPASLFASAGANTGATTAPSPSTPSLFPPTTTSGPAAPTSTNNASTGAAPAPSLFGANAPAATAAPSSSGPSASNAGATAQANTATSGPSASNAASTAPTLGASTTGQAPSAQSRLKNKSMDDIITRWASDLTKYQKEFQGQADKIAYWDRQLVENSNAVSKLYSKTWQAERDTAEIQKQLTTVEAQQEELSGWLDRYEREVDDLMSRQVSQQDGLQSTDQERERTYKTAEGVSERLGEMGQNLTSMIEEINAASAAITKTSSADDPLSQIVKVLNGHLSQLQLIDQGTAEIQSKIAVAQRDTQRVGLRGRGGFGIDAADEFGRSLRNRG